MKNPNPGSPDCTEYLCVEYIFKITTDDNNQIKMNGYEWGKYMEMKILFIVFLNAVDKLVYNNIMSTLLSNQMTRFYHLC